MWVREVAQLGSGLEVPFCCRSSGKAFACMGLSSEQTIFFHGCMVAQKWMLFDRL